MFHAARILSLHSPQSQFSSSVRNGNNGVFQLPSSIRGWNLFMICLDGGGWEHVSVQARLPPLDFV